MTDKHDKKGYKQALVIFFDILGSQSRYDFDELYEINELFHNEMLGNIQQNRVYNSYQRHIYTFSDCAYLIYDYKNKLHNSWGELFNIALLNCEPLLMKFLSKGIIARGGVAFGNVYYSENKNMFFGDAVNRAYQYEDKIAKFPRIIIDKYVANQIFEFNRNNENCLVKKDFDGQYYLNYFKTISEGTDFSPIIKKSNEEFINDLIALCEKNISLFCNNSNVCSKYEWLKKYAEDSINHNITGTIEYKKILWDQIIESFSKRNKMDELINYYPIIHVAPNTGIINKEHYKLLEESDEKVKE